MKAFTKKELKTALKGKEKSKTFQLVNDLPTSFNGEIPNGIAKGIVRMKGINAQIKNCAKTVVNSKRDTTAAQETKKTPRRVSHEG